MILSLLYNVISLYTSFSNPDGGGGGPMEPKILGGGGDTAASYLVSLFIFCRLSAA